MLYTHKVCLLGGAVHVFLGWLLLEMIFGRPHIYRGVVRWWLATLCSGLSHPHPFLKKGQSYLDLKITFNPLYLGVFTYEF